MSNKNVYTHSTRDGFVEKYIKTFSISIGSSIGNILSIKFCLPISSIAKTVISTTARYAYVVRYALKSLAVIGIIEYAKTTNMSSVSVVILSVFNIIFSAFAFYKFYYLFCLNDVGFVCNNKLSCRNSHIVSCFFVDCKKIFKRLCNPLRRFVFYSINILLYT